MLVDFGEEADVIRRYMAENKIEAPVAIDGRAMGSRPFAESVYGGQYLPHLLLVGKDREVLFSKGGFAAEELQPVLERVMGREPRLF